MILLFFEYTQDGSLLNITGPLGCTTTEILAVMVHFHQNPVGVLPKYPLINGFIHILFTLSFSLAHGWKMWSQLQVTEWKTRTV